MKDMYTEISKATGVERDGVKKVLHAASYTPQRSTQIYIYWRTHVSGPKGEEIVRVWRSDWQGDMFELMSKAKLNEIEKVFQTFGIRVIEADDD